MPGPYIGERENPVDVIGHYDERVEGDIRKVDRNAVPAL
jgi:hypothetical protein